MSMTSAGGKSFAQWLATTGPLYLTASRTVNDAQKLNYRTLGYVLRGQKMSDILSGGNTVNDRIYLDPTNKDFAYSPLEPMTHNISETGLTWTAQWKFFMNYLAWNDEAVLLNGGSSDMTGDAKFHAYKNYFEEMRQNLATDQANAWEARMWRVPSYAEMEATGGKEMFSIPTFITENDSGKNPLQAGAVDYDVSSGGDLAGINPDTYTKWANHVQTYGTTAGKGFEVGHVDNLLFHLDEAYLSIDFAPPPMDANYFESPASTEQPRPFIGCSKDGLSKAKYLYRESKDLWENMKDPYGNITYANAPIVHIAELDTAALYDDGASALADESGASITGPRYYCIHPKWLKVVFHKDRYFENLGTRDVPNQWTSHVMPINTYGQMVPRSRQRHAVLTPGSSY